MKIIMQLFKLMKTSILLLFISALVYSNSIISYASNEDPGYGRLSGDYIDKTFYDEDEPNQSNSNTHFYNDTNSHLHRYGTVKAKSPYTKTTYTHQNRFDNRTLLHGIDVSKWQGEIDWTKVKADGIDYAFIQVGFRGYGSSGTLSDATKDPYFETNMQNAIAAGVKVGVYVFSQATTEAEAIEEAQYILNAIGGYDISMPLVMDFEYASTDTGLGGRLYNAKLSKSKATAICMAFCKEIADAGYTPMIYANKSMLTDQLNASTLTDAGYRIWLANYTEKTTYTGTFDFWQYSENGNVKGIYGGVDMNFYYMQPTDNFAPVETTIASSVFSEIEDQTYTGSAITPEIKVVHNGITLIPNVDYTITYTNNTNVGVATAEITGIGAYTNTRRIQFEIVPKPVQGFKAKKRATNYITLGWKKDSSMNGYEIYRATSFNGTYDLIKTISKNSTTSFKNTKLTEGKCYYYKIRSFKKTGGKTYYSEFSPVSTIYTKTGYTKLALTKGTTPIYDYIPGTKTETITITEVVNKGPEDTTTDDTSTDSAVTDNATTNDYVNTDTSISETPEADSANQENGDTSGTPTDTQTETITVTKTVPTDSTTLTSVKKNKTINIIYSTKYKKKTWYYVSYKVNNVTHKGYIPSTKVTTAKLGKIVKEKNVNVRTKSTVYSKRITTLKRNTKVYVLSTKRKAGVTWYKVRFKKNSKFYNGWISAPYVKIV